MPGQLAKIKQQIAALEKKAQELVRVENRKVIDRIRSLIDKHGLSASDLGFGDAPGQKSPSTTASRYVRKGRGADAKKTSGAPMYQDPQSGKTWTGRGKPPNWIAAAADRSTYLIGAPAVEAAPAPTKSKRGTKSSKRVSAKPAEVSTTSAVAESGTAAATSRKPRVRANAKTAKKVGRGAEKAAGKKSSSPAKAKAKAKRVAGATSPAEKRAAKGGLAASKRARAEKPPTPEVAAGSGVDSDPS